MVFSVVVVYVVVGVIIKSLSPSLLKLLCCFTYIAQTYFSKLILEAINQINLNEEQTLSYRPLKQHLHQRCPRAGQTTA